jgi:hypothetical protein
VVTDTTYEMGDITFELNFARGASAVNPYDEYKKFVAFASKRPLKLHYQTPDMLEGYWYRDVELTKIEKGELDHYGVLVVPITLHPTDIWQNSVSQTWHVVPGYPSDTKKYELTRPYVYAAMTLDDVIITNNSPNPLPVTIAITGNVSDPQWNVSDANEVVYGRAKFIGTFDYVEVSSYELDEHIILKVDGVPLEHPYTYQDPSVGVPDEVAYTFLYLRPGTNHISFSLGTFDGAVDVSFRQQAVTV